MNFPIGQGQDYGGTPIIETAPMVENKLGVHTENPLDLLETLLRPPIPSIPTYIIQGTLLPIILSKDSATNSFYNSITIDTIFLSRDIPVLQYLVSFHDSEYPFSMWMSARSLVNNPNHPSALNDFNSRISNPTLDSFNSLIMNASQLCTSQIRIIAHNRNSHGAIEYLFHYRTPTVDTCVWEIPIKGTPMSNLISAYSHQQQIFDSGIHSPSPVHLTPYQTAAVKWMNQRINNKNGFLLADPLGYDCSPEIVAFLSVIPGPHLILCRESNYNLWASSLASNPNLLSIPYAGCSISRKIVREFIIVGGKCRFHGLVLLSTLLLLLKINQA